MERTSQQNKQGEPKPIFVGKGESIKSTGRWFKRIHIETIKELAWRYIESIKSFAERSVKNRY